MQVALLKELAVGFTANRMGVARAIREMREKDAEGFTAAAVDILRDSPEEAGTKFLLALLLAQPNGHELICDPDLFTPEQSLALVNQAKTLDSQVEVKLAKILSSGPLNTERLANLATRIMDILDRSADPMTVLPALRQLLQCPNPRVRSKAALLIGRISRNPQWAKLTDPLQDQRVVANAIESLWGLDSPAAKAAFREAANDPRNRVAGNGAIGLYVAGDQHGITALFRLSRHKEASFRATSAWSMGRFGDPRFMQRLEELTKDPDEMVNRAATKARTRIDARVDALKQQPTIPVQIRTAKYHSAAHEVMVAVGEPGALARGLNLFQFVVWYGETMAEEFAFAELSGDSQGQYQLNWNGPSSDSRLVKVEVFTEKVYGSDTGLELPF